MWCHGYNAVNSILHEIPPKLLKYFMHLQESVRKYSISYGFKPKSYQSFLACHGPIPSPSDEYKSPGEGRTLKTSVWLTVQNSFTTLHRRSTLFFLEMGCLFSRFRKTNCFLNRNTNYFVIGKAIDPNPCATSFPGSLFFPFRGAYTSEETVEFTASTAFTSHITNVSAAM